MNSHLEPIFKIVLPAIEKSGINYWVFGGVAIAGIKGKFYRKHQDIDIFVLIKDYEKADKIIRKISKINSWNTNTYIKNGRSKIEIYITGEERFSLVPIYEIGNKIKFIFPDQEKEFPRLLLKSVIHYIGNYKITTPSEELLKRLLRCRLRSFFRSEKKLWKTRKLDAEQLLGKEESKKLFQKK